MIVNSSIATLLLTSLVSPPYTNETEPYPQMVNNSLVIEIVSSLHDMYEFQNYVFYISERLVKDTDTAAEFFEDFWYAFPTAPTIIIINNPATMNDFLSTPSLCLVLTTERDDPIMELAATSLEGTRFLKTIFILFPIVETDEFYNTNEEFFKFYENIKLLYEWIWKEQFLNTILITIRNNIYTVDPYPTLNVINKTEIWSVDDFFPKQDVDFKGYLIQSPVKHDLPRVFRMPPKPMGRHQDFVSGVVGRLFATFVNSINATFNDTNTDDQENDSVDINALIRMVEDKTLEITVNSYTAMFPSLAGVSYPIGINDWCIMVPFRNRSPEHMYLIKTFNEYSWFLIGFSIFYITLGIWLCSPSPERDLSLSFLQSICSIILITPVRVLTLPYARLRFLYVLLFIMGFFITVMYITKMASFLTATTTEQQIDTIADIIAADLSIMMLDYEYSKMETMNYPNEFLELIHVTTKNSMDKHRDRFNTSFGYSIQSDRWNFLNKQQQYLKKPLFRLTSVCIGPYYHVFPMQRDSHLGQPLKQFIMSASQYGLMQYWNSEAFADALYLGYVHMILVNEDPLPLSIAFFRSLWYLWWFGLLLAGLAFICEVKSKSLIKAAKSFGRYFNLFKRKMCEI